MPAYTPPGGTIKFEESKTDGRHVAVAASGNSDPLAAEKLDGDINHGSRIRVTTDGTYDFKTKENNYPKHWEFGDEVFINGTATSQASVGGTPPVANWDSYVSAEITDQRLRHNNVTKQWTSALGKGTAKTLWSQAFNGRDASYLANGNYDFYAAYWIWTGCNYYRAFFAPSDSITGTFSYPREGVRGEVVDIDDGTSIWNAYITGVSSSNVLTLDVDIQSDAGLPTASDIQGATITGQTSGATANIPSTADVSSGKATKHLRVWQTADNDDPLTKYTFSSVNAGLAAITGTDSVGSTIVNIDDPGIGFPSEVPEEWDLIEFAITYDDTSGTAWQWLNGQLLHKSTGLDTAALNEDGFRLTTIGMDLPGVSPLASTDVSFTADWNEIYADNDTKRVYLYQGTDFASSGKNRELQRHTSWSSIQFDFVANHGALDPSLGFKVALVDGETVIFDSLEVS